MEAWFKIATPRQWRCRNSAAWCWGRLAQSFETDLRQIFEDPGLTDRIRVEVYNSQVKA